MSKSDEKPRAADAALGARFVRGSSVGAVRLVELHLPEVLDSEEFDHVNAALLKEMAAVGGGRCVLDLSAVEYMGSSMLGLMVNARQRVKSAGGRLVLCGMSAWLVQTFHTCSLERLFVMAPTRDEAMKAVERK
jgi:anti-anti-sigma factor